MRITGRWRITEMEMWDQGAIDLVRPGFIEFGGDGLGQFGFVAVQGELDCREAAGGRPGAEFSWEGDDDGSAASGRGWAVLNPDGSLEGRVFFHLGDESSSAPCPSAPGRARPEAPGACGERDGARTR